MNGPGSAREALIAEAIGDLGKLLDRAQALHSAMNESRRALLQAQAQLAQQLATFEAQTQAFSERAKVQVVKHVLARTEEAARRSIDQQSQAMADAARAAFSAELGATLQRLQSTLQQLMERRTQLLNSWLALGSVAASAAALTWMLTAWL